MRRSCVNTSFSFLVCISVAQVLGCMVWGQSVRAGDAIPIDRYQNVVRAGYLKVIPQDESGELQGPLGLTPLGATTDVLDASSFAISYERRLNEFLAIEAVGGFPPQFVFEGNGTIASLGAVGEARAISPTVFLNFYPLAHGGLVSPFLGLGVTYTRFIDETASQSLEFALVGPTEIELSSFVAPIVKMGADMQIAEQWLLTAAVSYSWAESTATITTGNITREIDVRLDPVVLSLALGFAF